MTNVLEEMLAHGITRGLEEGRAEGIREGEDAGKRAALHTMLTARFGQVPPALEAHIEAAKGPALDALIVQAAIAKKIEKIPEPPVLPRRSRKVAEKIEKFAEPPGAGKRSPKGE